MQNMAGCIGVTHTADALIWNFPMSCTKKRGNPERESLADHVLLYHTHFFGECK